MGRTGAARRQPNVYAVRCRADVPAAIRWAGEGGEKDLGERIPQDRMLTVDDVRRGREHAARWIAEG
jgi:hypothetical protein